MERYAPNAKDLASRDVVSRAIATEVRDGRGCGPDKDHVMLKLDHLGDNIVKKRLPGIRDSCMTFINIDPIEQPIPVYPTAHYTMGGIPTNRYGEVVAPERHGPEEATIGLYAAGECACVSVHGANRLGGNSLLDILVFGRASGKHIVDHLQTHRYHRPMDQNSVEAAMAHLARWDRKGEGEDVYALKAELKKVMEAHCGVFRQDDVLSEGFEKVCALEKRLQDAVLADHSRVFNTARIEALELENLMDVALATIKSSWARKESRGAHSRIDFTERDDKNWLKHSLYLKADKSIDFKPVHLKPLSVETFPPKARVY